MHRRLQTCSSRSVRCCTTATLSGTRSTSARSGQLSGWTTRSRYAPSPSHPFHTPFRHPCPVRPSVVPAGEGRPFASTPASRRAPQWRAAIERVLLRRPSHPPPAVARSAGPPLQPLRQIPAADLVSPLSVGRLSRRKRRPSSRRSWTRCARSASRAGPSARSRSEPGGGKRGSRGVREDISMLYHYIVGPRPAQRSTIRITRRGPAAAGHGQARSERRSERRIKAARLPMPVRRCCPPARAGAAGPKRRGMDAQGRPRAGFGHVLPGAIAARARVLPRARAGRCRRTHSLAVRPAWCLSSRPGALARPPAGTAETALAASSRAPSRRARTRRLLDAAFRLGPCAKAARLGWRGRSAEPQRAPCSGPSARPCDPALSAVLIAQDHLTGKRGPTTF